jgi:DNA-binding GntR family transcriptional regulator
MTMDDQNGSPLAVGSERRLVDLVYKRLRTAIVTEYFEPGARLAERDLAKQLTVSRTPIREAVKRLEQDGLVVCEPHRGYYVRQPSFEEARQAYELRAALEGLATDLAAQRATPEELRRMRDAIRRGEAALRSGDHSTLLLHNNELHQLVVNAAHNQFLTRAFQTMWSYVDLLRGRWWAHTDRPADGHGEHERIVAAISGGDAPLARRLAEEHVARAWRSIARKFDARTGENPVRMAAQKPLGGGHSQRPRRQQRALARRDPPDALTIPASRAPEHAPTEPARGSRTGVRGRR